jgi:TonB family protein
MSILGNKHNLLLEDEIEEVQEEYELPAVVRKSQEDMPLKKSLIISTLLHPTVVGLIAMILFVLALLGITLSIFERPQPKMNDIEFVLVDKEQAPINQNTKYRSDKNSRAGGIHDPKRKVSMPSPSPKKSVKKSASSAVSPAKTKKAVNKPLAQNKAKSTPKKVVQKSPTPNKSNARPQPPSARPSLKPTAPKLSSNPKPQFAVPVPKTNLPQGSRSSGPVGGTGSARTSGGGSYAPVPSLSPSMGSGSGSSGSRMARGGSGSGQYGNPGPGNPNGAPGIDAIREPDFGPYMRELQRKIKMNWDPPRGNESKRVVLLFKIARDGRLLSTRVFKSSGLPNADKAALNAVSLSAPFRPLPPAFKGQSIDIQFTFDYNVFGAKQY